MGIWFQNRRRHLRRHLLLQQLEDRVVLDASINPVQQDNQVATDNVGVADPVDNAAGNAPATTGDGAQGGAQEAPNTDPLSQVYGQNLNEVLVTNAPDQVESVQASATDQDHENARVLVVSSTLSGADVLAAAAQPGVITVTFDGYLDTPGQILASIEAALGGKKAESIALAAHDVGEGQFHLAGAYSVSLTSAMGEGEVHAFFEGLGNFLTADGRIDLLACNVTANDAGAQLVGVIEGISGHDVAASVDATGNPASGGDWILEDGNIDVASLYFDPQTLLHYDGILVNSPPVLNLGHGAGSLDFDFSADGKVTTPIGSANDWVYSMAIQADGKIVVAGCSAIGSGYDFAVARYNIDGSLDTSFDGDGKVTTPIGSGTDSAYSVAIQSDGKIVVAGYSSNGSNNDFAVARYNSNGSLDTSFDGDGKVMTPIGSSDDYAYSIAIQSDNKIVVAGYSSNGSNDDLAVARYNSNGSLDTSFDGDGKVTTPLGSSNDRAYSVAIQSDGKIVVAGYSSNGSNDDFAVARYNSIDGSLDTSFDGDGKVITPIGSSHDRAMSVAIQSDGKIVAAGYSSNGSNNDFALVRYNGIDGTLDTSFDGDGKVTTPIGSAGDSANSVAIQSDGKIVAAGYSWNGSNDDFAVVRYNSIDGSLDMPFGGDGKVVTPIGSSSDTATSVVIQADGKIVAAGYSWNGSNNDFALARYDASPLNYTENSGPVVIDSAITITDSDSANMASATVQITGNYSSGLDILSIDSGNLLGGVTANWNSVAGSLTLTGVTSAANYESMLEHVKYTNSSDNPSTAVRTVTWTVSDGLANSAAQASAISVDPVNDAPVLSLSTTPGSLDLTFSGDGKVTTPIGSNYDYANSVAIQGDGKIVVAGYSYNGANSDFALVRYNIDGSLDTTFDGDGKVMTAVGSSGDEAYSVAIQADGKIVVAGWTVNGSYTDLALARYNTDGSLDTTFDGDGIVITPIGPGSDRAYSVAIQGDGKIVAAGWASNGYANDFALARYNSDGSLDTSFDGDGKVMTAVGSSGDEAHSVAIQPDGKIVAAGYSAMPGAYNDFALVRYNGSDGSLDTSFGGDGKVTTAIGSSYDSAMSVAIQADGKIVAAGCSSGTGAINDFALARYNGSDGSLDTSFDGDGKVTTPIGSSDDVAYSVAIQADGKIVMAGYAQMGSYYDFALARYNGSDGSLDMGFGGDRTVTTHIGSSYEQANSVAIQADGKIVVAGMSGNDFALARYYAGPLNYTENSGAVVIDSAVTITDADSANMGSATIQITGNYHNGQDFLSIDSGDLLGGVTAGWDSITGKLTLTGVTTAANYESMLEHAKYTNTSDDPSTAVRAVTWMVNDGVDDSAPQVISLSVDPVNDAPANTVPGSVTATVNTLTAISGVSISDADAGTNVVHVALGVTHGILQVSGTVAGGLTAGQISGNGTSSVVLSGTLAQIDSTLAHSTGLQYQSALNYTGPDTLTVSSNDLGATGSGGALTTVSTVSMTVNSWTLEFESTGWATDYWRHADGAGGYDVLFAYNSSAQQYYQHEGSSTSPYGNGASWRAIGDTGVVPAGALLDGNVHALKADGSLTFQFDSTYHKVNYTSTLLGHFYHDFDHGIGDGLWYQKVGPGATDWAQAGETEQVWFQYSADPTHCNLGSGFEYEYHPVYGVSYWRQADGLGGYDVLFAYAHSAGQWYQNEGTTSSPYGTQWYTLGAAGALGTDYGLLDGNTHELAAGLSYSYDGMQHRAYVTSTLLGQFYYDFDHSTGDGLWYQKVGPGPSDWAQGGETEQVWFQYGADPNHWNLGNGFEYEYNPAWGVSYWRQADGLGGYDVLFAYAHSAGQWYQNEGTTSSPYGAQWYTLGAAGALGDDYGLLDGNTHQLAAGLTYSYDGMLHRSNVTSTLLGQFYYDFDHATGDGLWYQKIGPGPTDWAQAGETEQVWFQYGADPNHWNLGSDFEYEYHPAWGVSYWRHADGLGGYDVLFAYAHSAEQWYQNEGTTSSPYGTQWYTLGAAGALGTNYGLLDGSMHQLAAGLTYSYDGMQQRAYVSSTLLGQFYYDFDHSAGDGLWYQQVGPGPTDWAQAGETAQVWFEYGATPYAPWDLGNGFAYEYNPAWGVSYWRHADGMGGYDVLFAYAHSAGQWYQNEGTTSSPYGAQWYTLGAAGALGDNYGLLDGNTHQLASGLSYRFDAMQHRSYWMSDLMGQFFYDFDHAVGDGLWYQYQPGSTSWLPANETEQVWFQYGADPNHWTVGSGFEYEYSTAYATSYWRQPIGGATYTVLYAYGANTGQWYEQTTPTTNPYGDAWVTIPSRPTAIG